ncbi:MAG TPA: hypothetical protein VGB42_08990 [Candidatus Thermoplasmatota archaeon]
MKTTPIGLVVALAAAVVLSAVPASAVGISGPHVTAFFAAPNYVNLAMETDVTLEIGSSAGAGQDNYMVTVWSPSGAQVGAAWYNFSSPGSMSKVLGNVSDGLTAAVDEVGFYTLRAEWWNDTSAALEPAAEAVLQATDLLVVTTEFAAGSDPLRDLHNCQLAEEFQRGDGIIARGYVRYASTGEILNGTSTPSARGNVTGTLFATDRDPATKALTYQNTHQFWRAAWELDWDATIGVFLFTVNAADGLGNVGVGVSPPAGIFGSLKLVPSVLETTLWMENETGDDTRAFYPGDTVTVVVGSYYDQHFNHNWNYTNTDGVNQNQSYRLGPDRGGAATAVLGIGAFDTTTQTFETQLASLTLTFDDATGTWRGDWAVPATGVLAGNITVKAFARDGAPTPNEGKATSTFSTLPVPPPEIVTETVYNNQTIYRNETVQVAPPGTMDSMLGYALAGVGIAIGAALGLMAARGRRGGPGAGSKDAPKAPPATGGEEKPKKKEDEGWD